MKRRWVRWLLFVVACTAAIAIVVWLGNRAPVGPEIVCAETPRWRAPGALQMRSEDAGSEVLLFRFVPRPNDQRDVPVEPDQDFNAIYRHRPNHRELELVDWRAWDGAVGDVSECPLRPLQSSLHLRDGFGGDFLLRFDGRVIPTAGKGVVVAAVAPNSELAAVVSSEIPQTPGMVFHDRPSGQFYHQFFRTQDGLQIGETLRLPRLSRGRNQPLETCWTTDSRYLVYSNESHSRLCVVGTPRPSGQ